MDPYEPCVKGLSLKFFKLRRSGELLKGERYAGMEFPAASKGQREGAVHGRTHEPHTNQTHFARPHLPRQFQGSGHSGLNLADFFHEHRSCGRQGNTSGRAPKELHSQFRFQPCDTLAEGGLGHMQSGGRTTEMQFLRQRKAGFHIFEIHC